MNKAKRTYQSSVLSADRHILNGHRSSLLWFAGLSGSGKSTIAAGSPPIQGGFGYEFLNELWLYNPTDICASAGIAEKAGFHYAIINN